MAGMACVFFLYAASGLVAPWWAVVLLLVVWALLLRRGVPPGGRLHPRWVPWMPVFAVVLWFVVVNAGGAWLGWTA